jgi:Leucine-rich repeat (LRR) protein
MKMYLNLTRKGLVELPQIPERVDILWCYHNKLKKLDGLPDSLITLHCANNLITELVELPKGLQELMCHKNPLINLPPFPLSLSYIRISPWQIDSCLRNGRKGKPLKILIMN